MIFNIGPRGEEKFFGHKVAAISTVRFLFTALNTTEITCPKINNNYQRREKFLVIFRKVLDGAGKNFV
jgi:hypothetical protein